MQTLTISYSRRVYFRKTIKVSDKLAERLLKLNGEYDLMAQQTTLDDEIEDLEIVDEETYKADLVPSDDFCLLAEELTDVRDIHDLLNVIDDISVVKEK